jgi:DNA repair protein RecN (Recombination protein N)
MIRHGEDESTITATFTDLTEYTKESLTLLGVRNLNELTITRTISNKGKNSIKVNGESVTLTQLKQIGSFLGDIHVQHDTYRLINKDNYLSFLDDFKDKKFLNL